MKKQTKKDLCLFIGAIIIAFSHGYIPLWQVGTLWLGIFLMIYSQKK
jgi:hypothetical protein